MASALPLAARSFQDIIDKLTNQNDDPRVGSGREGSGGGGTLSGANGNKSASLPKLGSTFVPIIVYVAVCLLIFLFGRRRFHRVYAPRTFPALRAPEKPTPALPNGWFDWILPFFRIPDTFVLNHGSLDGFFFLRFLKVMRNICFVGCAITWPILFPLHLTGGKGESELESLSMGNVRDSNRLYANVVVAWLLFSFVLFTVARESIYYVNMRQAYLSSPYYSQRLSSRTVLFTSVPKRYLDEARIRKLYGDSVKRVWLPRTSKHLVNLVKEREQTALRLEKAEIELIKSANAVRRKQQRKNPKHTLKGKFEASETQLAKAEEGKAGSEMQLTTTESQHDSIPRGLNDSPEVGESAISPFPGMAEKVKEEDAGSASSDDSIYTHPYGLKDDLPDVRGSVASQYLPAESRPYHRPIANYGRRIDTIRWTRRRLLELNRDIAQIRKRLKSPHCKTSNTLSAAFVEFDSQESAQAAHQVLAHHQPLHMAPRLLGIRPDEVVWGALRMKWWERIIRRFAMLGLIVAGIIFWSIPSCIVGVISNVSEIASIFPFLNWINQLPGPILGLLTGFLPAAILSLLMAIVPVLMRKCARAAGVPSLSMVELFTQTAYFAFQVVQVFLITTLTSAASTAVFKILGNPMIAKDILAQNLPKSSNFYISYILIQCLANAGTAILQPFDLIRHGIMSFVAQVPRTRYRVWRTMRPARWGRDFPVFANLGVIALAYAVIAPLILIFAALGMWFTHMIWRYNLIFVIDSDLDSKGLFYPRALIHLTVGLYLAEVCLIGLFIINNATGPAVLMILLFVASALVHFSVSQAIYPLLHNLPQTLQVEEEIQEEERAAAEAALAQDNETEGNTNGAASSYFDAEQAFGDEDDDLGPLSDDEDTPNPIGSRALEGAGTVRETVRSTVGNWVKGLTKETAEEQASWLGLKFSRKKMENDLDSPPGFLSKWFNPHIHEDFITIRKGFMTLPSEAPEYDHDRRRTYYPPELWSPKPILWIPEDDARVSRQEVAHTRKSTPISDKGARLDESGRLIVRVEEAPFLEPRLIL